MHKALVSTALALFVAITAARADLIELRDGQKLSGTMLRQGESVTIATDDGRTVSAKPDDILKVTLTGKITPAEAAAAQWTRISTQIKAADDLQSILALHKAYLDKHPDAANVTDVRSSLGVFQKLADSNAVKFRGRWVAKAQIDVILRGWIDAARPAVDQYNASKYKEALDAAKSALDADKENPNALTVAGLAAYHLNNLALARTYFTSLLAADPGSPLAENNLAVISFQQKQPGEGLYHYMKALQIAPDNRLVLDNIIEGVNAYLAGNNDKNATNLKNLQRLFDTAEKHMEETLAKQGLVRRGSTWVTKDQADRSFSNTQALQLQYAQLENQYNAAKAAVAQFENLIRQADSDYNSALVSILIMNDQIVAAQQLGNGTLMLQLLVSRDIAVANANRFEALRAQYQAQRDQVIAASRDLIARGDHLRAAIIGSTVRLSGTQRIMDLGEAENPPAPATLPS